MGFLSRFRRSAKTLDDIGSIASEEDLTIVPENVNEAYEVKTSPISEFVSTITQGY